MCHLSVEKALKGIYSQAINKLPPRTHNLLLLIEKIRLEITEESYDFVFELNGVSVSTRYPEDIEKMKKDYDRKKPELVLEKSKGLLKWLKRK